MRREEVYKAIDSERWYQNEKWNENTTDTKGEHSASEWLLYIQDYLTEAIHIVSRNPDPKATKDVMHSIRKITAMGVAAMEQMGVENRSNE